MTYDDYQLRKDIDTVMQIADTLQRILSENNVSSLSELLSQYYDKSEIDFDTAKLNTSLDRVSTSLQTVYDDLNVLNEDLYDAEGHLKVTEEDMNQAKASITALNTSLTQLGNDLNNAEADLEDIESDLATAKSNLSQAIADLTNLSTELDTAKGRITTAEGKITTAENSISNHQTSISNLNTELNSAKDRITATENSLTTANNSISAHETSISNLNTDLDSAETRLTTTEQNIQSLRTSLTELDGSLTVLSDMLIDFQGTMAEFDAELIERGIDKTDLNTDIYKLVRQICVVKQDITDTDTKIDDTVTDINNLDTTVVPNLKNKIQEAKASGDTAQQDLATAKTDINNLNSSTFPNLKNKIDEAKASGDTAQTALQQTKDDLEDLNTTVFPNLVGAIDDAQTSGDTAQQNLSQAITDINNVTAQGGTFAQLHGSIATAKSAGDTAQQNLDDSIDDIENLTGQVFPNLVNHINTTVSDISQAQTDISQAQTDISQAQEDISSLMQPQVARLFLTGITTAPSISSQEYLILTTIYGYPGTEIEYWLSGSSSFYRKNANDIFESISSDDLPDPLFIITFNNYTNVTVSPSLIGTLAYTVDTNKFYKITSYTYSGGEVGKFTELSEIPNFIANQLLFESLYEFYSTKQQLSNFQNDVDVRCGLLEAVRTDTITFYAPSVYMDSTKCVGTLSRQGNIVVMHLELYSQTNHPDTNYKKYVDVSGVPALFAPTSTVYHSFANFSNNYNGAIKITTNGAIEVRTASANQGVAAIFNVTYIREV